MYSSKLAASKNRICDKDTLLRLLGFLVSAFLGALFFSETTSPIFSDWGYDSAMFQTIGKYWAQGYLPYVSLFDHKGPFIFLINAIGYAICDRTGVFIIQVLFLAVDEYLAWRLLSKCFSKFFSFTAAFLLPVVLAANWQLGNTTEEYILPFLFASYMLMLNWSDSLKQGEYEHRPLHAFVYGLSFAFALLTRVTNALGVCVGVAFIVVMLVIKGKWKNLGQNALAFILGVAVFVVPMCIYFAVHGALYDMWYGTLIFNFDYLSDSGLAAPDGIFDFLSLIRKYLTGWCLVAAAALALIFRKKERTGMLFWLLIALTNTLFMYTLNDYAHYGIVLLPLLYVALYLLGKEYFDVERERERTLLRAAVMCMSAIVLVSSGLKIYRLETDYKKPTAYAYEDYGDDCTTLISFIPEDERDSFVAFDCPRRLYLKTGIKPAFRFFTLQQWMSSHSESFTETLRSEFEESNVKWVMTFNLYSDPFVTTDIINEKYTQVAETENGMYRLYCLK